jgi:ubiquinol-cytochrome c reductase cytochrome c subunit
LRAAWEIVLLTFVVAALSLVAVAACDGNDEATHSHTSEFIAEGQALFSAHCADCHGADAQGTGRGGNIAGESESFVTNIARHGRAVDRPTPLFTVDDISDDELHKIAAFVESLD